MITFFKHTTFKYLLLMMLSFKAGYFVYENVSNVPHSQAIEYVLDFDDLENEEKKEFDESEKINQTLLSKDIIVKNIFKIKTDNLSENYRNFYFEYTTPPPEFS